MTNQHEHEHGLGRRPAHGLGEDKDSEYPLRAALVAPPPLPKSKHWPIFYRALDQGATGTCVGHAAKHWMLSAPVIQTKPTVEPSAITLYREAAAVDEWPQNDDGDLNFGTSVRAVFKVMQARGLVAEYRWAQSMDDVVTYLSTQGPLVIGVNWYEGMFHPGPKGYIAPAGRVAGGHAVLLIGRNNQRGDTTILNSWGRWGTRRNGRALIKDADLERLLFAESGEAAAGLEVRLPKG